LFAWVLAMALCLLAAVSRTSGPGVLDIVIALVNGYHLLERPGDELVGHRRQQQGWGAGTAPGIGGAGRRQAPRFFSPWL
jgi:hypothetical protein